MAHDYRGFQDKIGADMATASATAAGMEKKGGKATKVRIRQSDLEPLIPSGAMIEYIPVAAHKIKFGDVVFVRAGKELVLRRFIGFQIGKNGSMICVARANPAKQEVRRAHAQLQGKLTLTSFLVDFRDKLHPRMARRQSAVFDACRVPGIDDNASTIWIGAKLFNHFTQLIVSG